MITGIECAGLLLGVFPLVLEGLKFYLHAVDRVKQMRRHEATLTRFLREVDMEKCKFDNIWYSLISISGIDPKIVAEPMPWDPSVEEKLLACLPSHSVPSFVGACQDLNDILKKLAQRFQKYNEDTAGYKKMLRVLRDFTPEYRQEQIDQINRLNSNLDKLVNGIPPTLIPEIKRVYGTDIPGQYKHVRKHAVMILRILKEKLQSSTSCHCKVPHTANLQLELRFGGIQSVYGKEQGSDTVPRFSVFFPVAAGEKESPSLKAPGWREVEIEHLQHSSCESSPCSDINVYQGAHAVLKADYAGKTAKLDGYLLNSTPPVQCHEGTYKRDIIPRPSALKKISKTVGQWLEETTGLVRGSHRSRSPSPMPSNVSDETEMPVRLVKQVKFSLENQVDTTWEETAFKPTTEFEAIQCLCSAIHQAPEAHTCLGLLVGDDRMKHRIWVPKSEGVSRSIHGPSLTQIVSLAEMLLNWPKPSKKERLKLGVNLASSVLQLHETEWLRERWTKQDIFFIREPLNAGARQNVDLNHPVVHQAFTALKQPTPQEPAESLLVRCNKSLVCLGIVLIELCYWKDLNSLQNGNAGNRVECASAAHSLAVGMIDQLYDDAGFTYGESVRRCITGLDLRETQLECDEFKKEVYYKIVQPLERDLMEFCDASLAEIFQKNT
ncbi:hypothetical protein EV426DRAFT_597389 [Tirmania nivea]|nr:hypothetical protein EV426DRAFT_597389 [Tirmania nivea]